MLPGLACCTTLFYYIEGILAESVRSGSSSMANGCRSLREASYPERSRSWKPITVSIIESWHCHATVASLNATSIERTMWSYLRECRGRSVGGGGRLVNRLVRGSHVCAQTNLLFAQPSRPRYLTTPSPELKVYKSHAIVSMPSITPKMEVVASA